MISALGVMGRQGKPRTVLNRGVKEPRFPFKSTAPDSVLRVGGSKGGWQKSLPRGRFI